MKRDNIDNNIHRIIVLKDAQESEKTEWIHFANLSWTRISKTTDNNKSGPMI